MSETASAARGGEFATSSKATISEHFGFILAKHAEGVPAQAIARMIGCNVADVRAAIGREDKPRTTYVPPVAPKTSHARMAKAREGMPPAVRAVINDVAARHGMTFALLVGDRQYRKVAHARQEVYAILYATGCYSLPIIGQWMGGRDHTTVLSGIRKFNARGAEILQLEDAALESRRAYWRACKERVAA